jgi:hypothetical protein
VVDRVGFEEGVWLDPEAHPHSDELHVTEPNPPAPVKSPFAPSPRSMMIPEMRALQIRTPPQPAPGLPLRPVPKNRVHRNEPNKSKPLNRFAVPRS